ASCANLESWKSPLAVDAAAGWTAMAPIGIILSLLCISPFAAGQDGVSVMRPGSVGRGARPRPSGRSLAEQSEQDGGRGVGDRQRLHTQLLLGLQSLESGAFLGQIGVHQVADAGFQG